MNSVFNMLLLVTMAGGLFGSLAVYAGDVTPLAGTQPLTMEGDIASELVSGVDRFLLGKIEAATAQRGNYWKRDFSSAEKYNASVEPNRKRLAHILGARDPRTPFDDVELVGSPSQPARVGQSDSYEIFAVRWPAFANVNAEGLLLVPKGKVRANVIAVPDCANSPEQLAGLEQGLPPESQTARRLAEAGCRVLVPLLINRAPSHKRQYITNREYVYRAAFVLGRHIIGYEIQKILAGVDWFAKTSDGKRAKIAIHGYGEGGLLALAAAALDTRIDAVCVSGYFDDRRNLWQEPIDRNVFGLLEQFGDAELASLIAPRKLIVDASHGPELILNAKLGAPARLVSPELESVRREVERARTLTKDLSGAQEIELVSDGGLSALLSSVAPGAKLQKKEKLPESAGKRGDSAARHTRQLQELDRHTQALLLESSYVRQAFMKELDTSSPEKFQKAAGNYREHFRREVIGHFDDSFLPFNARTRKVYETPKYTGYEVVLDVFPDVIAYGILLLPANMKEGEKRPVVVCQHGLEGRPQETVTGANKFYHDFAAKLAERGFITFSPQNLYIFRDRFRTLQRKANPLKKTLFSIITPQHQQILNWLKTLPNVDPQRLAFYGLSYGGKTAMRVPALVSDYCLSICSGDFNEWVWKNASSRSSYSYVHYDEYEIFEFDLGSTFNYAEMAALIAPRPFMVERGHFDNVAPDEMVAYEFAKVQFLYEARLKLTGRCEIEYFNGPHMINGKGTFDFLHRHLNWP
ncbi:MAG TPA: dienelactone hydrolase family protein [Planctomycetota bacterium]|nr:dienelactone hydrolase family protein [Planctomycetota bacterium]